MRGLAVLLAGVLLLAACHRPTAAPTDDQIIADLAADRGRFEQIADLLEPGRPLIRVERRKSGWLILPAGAEGEEADRVRRFLVRRGISSAAVGQPADGNQVWFVLFEGAPKGLEYQSKTLIRGVPGTDWRFVDDTDRAIRPPLSKPRVVYRSVGEDWYIRSSAL